MRSISLFVFVFALSLSSKSQDFEAWFETWTEQHIQTEESERIEQFLQELDQIKLKPKLFSQANQWSVFFFLDDEERSEIRQYIEANPHETSMVFLNRIKSLELEKAWLIRQLYRIQTQPTRGQKQDQQLLLYTGKSDQWDNNGFKLKTRLSLKHNDVQAFFQTEKDEHETKILDHISGGITLDFQKTKLYLGDIDAHFGMGLSLSQRYQMPNLALQNTSQTGFRTHRSSHESRFFRGLALHQYWNKYWSSQHLISHRVLDSRIDNQVIDDIFLEENHQSNLDLQRQNNSKLTSHVHAVEWKKKTIRNSTVFHAHRYNLEINLGNNQYKNQKSLSNFTTIHFGRVFTDLELNLDQFRYLSALGKIGFSLGHRLFLSTYYLTENQDFENPFRSSPSQFSTPEQSYGYLLQFGFKKHQLTAQYQLSETQPDAFQNKRYQRWRLNTTFRLPKRYFLRTNLSYKTTAFSEHQHQEKNQHLLHRLSLDMAQRGKWNFRQSIYSKYLSDKGLAIESKLSFREQNTKVTLALLVYNQQAGAFYFYENDMAPFGYIKGYFGSGLTSYGLIQQTFNTFNLYLKARFTSSSNQEDWMLSCGLRLKFD
ncbi:MAG: hypothetical protein ACPG4W_01200 [Flavobacteriales bacterium]